MPKHLSLSAESTHNWRLPADTDVDGLRNRLRTAMEKGQVIDVQVEMNNDPRATAPVLINGNNLLVYDLPEPQRRSSEHARPGGLSCRAEFGAGEV
jgi:hypothetical protein